MTAELIQETWNLWPYKYILLFNSTLLHGLSKLTQGGVDVGGRAFEHIAAA